MDRHVRWFARQIVVGVLKRITIEAAVVGFAVLAISIVSGASPSISLVAAFSVMPVFVLARLTIACLANPLTSTYLASWPQPNGTIIPTSQTNKGSEIDMALRMFGFTAAVSIDEWGGANTNLYTRESNQIVAMTSGDDDLIVLSELHDGRFVVSTTQLVLPHEQLVVNRRTGVDAHAVVSSHVEVLGRLTRQGNRVRLLTIDHIMEFLAIEWDAWDQIGPFVGPFVAVGTTRRPTLLTVTVPGEAILERTVSTKLRTEASDVNREPATAPPASAVPAPAAPVVHAQPPPVPAPQTTAQPQPTLTPPPVPQTNPALTPPPIPTDLAA